MIDMLRYGLNDDGIRIDLPQHAFDEATADAVHFSRLLDQTLTKQLVEVEQGEGGVRLLLNTKKLGTIGGDSWVQNERARALTYVATMASAYTDLDAHDPDVLFVNLSLDAIGDGKRYGMDAAINRWIAPSHEVEALTTKAMGKTALNLGLMFEHQLRDRVYARVDTAYGIRMQADELRRSSLDTGDGEYAPDEQVLYLHGHNVHDRQSQLILLSGLIAVAKS